MLFEKKYTEGPVQVMKYKFYKFLKSFPYPGNNSRIIPLTSITVNWIEKNGNLRVRELATINLRNAYLLTC